MEWLLGSNRFKLILLEAIAMLYFNSAVGFPLVIPVVIDFDLIAEV